MLWTAAQYAEHAGIPLRTAQYRLARWCDGHGAVRVVRETLASGGRGTPPRTRLLLDVASWRAATGIVAAT